MKGPLVKLSETEGHLRFPSFLSRITATAHLQFNSIFITIFTESVILLCAHVRANLFRSSLILLSTYHAQTPGLGHRDFDFITIQPCKNVILSLGPATDF